MAEDKVMLPSGSGGLVRFNEDNSSAIQIKPEMVIVLLLLVIGFEAILRLI